MKVKLLTNGGFIGLDACIGKEFDTMSDGNSNGSVRIATPDLIAAGYYNSSLVPSLYFFDWEVEVINE